MEEQLDAQEDALAQDNGSNKDKKEKPKRKEEQETAEKKKHRKKGKEEKEEEKREVKQKDGEENENEDHATEKPSPLSKTPEKPRLKWKFLPHRHSQSLMVSKKEKEAARERKEKADKVRKGEAKEKADKKDEEDQTLEVPQTAEGDKNTAGKETDEGKSVKKEHKQKVKEQHKKEREEKKKEKEREKEQKQKAKELKKEGRYKMETKSKSSANLDTNSAGCSEEQSDPAIELSPAVPRERRLAIGAASDAGQCDYQEDRWLALSPLTDDPDSSFVAVYDGHGGTEAADYCRKHLHNILTADPVYKDDKKRALVNAFVETDKNYLSKLEDAGCTAICALIQTKNRLVQVANAGDCRCIVGLVGGTVKALTVDHKPDLPGERKRIEAAGSSVLMENIIDDGLRTKVARIDDRLACSRSIGDPDFKETPGSPDNAVSCYPDVYDLPITDKERFLVLACDGLYDYMTNEEIAAFVHGKLDAIPPGQITDEVVETVAQALIAHAVHEMDAADNTTAVMVVFV
eukprot:TRINITY_DN1368_c0_g1_i4.p1 TRINITY_DN1368_c0_g1~~TRINITY_DN1368_c0_g1_i4.p1  ORF type:complete len:569 (+),score=164.33 TRINITY_DN1368_c0_g1_i4:154-1707(+)